MRVQEANQRTTIGPGGVEIEHTGVEIEKDAIIIE